MTYRYEILITKIDDAEPYKVIVYAPKGSVLTIRNVSSLIEGRGLARTSVQKHYYGLAGKIVEEGKIYSEELEELAPLLTELGGEAK